MIVAIIGGILLGLISVLYLLLGLGAPLGYLAWGGKHRKTLPKQLRVQSLLSIPAQLFAIYVLLRLGNVFSEPTSIFIFIVFGYIFMIFFTINIVMNLVSRSVIEKAVMTPITIYIVFAFIYVLFIG